MVMQKFHWVKSGEAYFDYKWYSKSGFKPQIGYRYFLPWGTASIGYSKSIQ